MRESFGNFTEIKVCLKDDFREKEQFHPETILLYAPTGALDVFTEDGSFRMQKEDVAVLNQGSTWRIENSLKSVYCEVCFSYDAMARAAGGGNFIFYCNSALKPYLQYSGVRNILHRMVISFLGGGAAQETDCLRYGLSFELLDQLLRYYRKDFSANDKTDGTARADSQVLFVKSSVMQNYGGSIRLSEIADRLYVSTATLSRNFKRITGVYFSEYVQRVRLNYAVRFLIETDASVTKIAVDCGFSNPSVFSKAFQAEFHVPPSVFRKNEQKARENGQEMTVGGHFQEVESKLRQAMNGEESWDTPTEQKIAIDLRENDGIPFEHFWSVLVNFGAACNLTKANLQFHVEILAKQLKFRYIRIWNVFSEDMMIHRSTSDRHYNFDILDNVLDFLVGMGLKPFIDFSPRPETALVSEGKTLYYTSHDDWMMDRLAWQSLFSAFLRHIINRFGNDETEQWYYEFTVDPRNEESEKENAVFDAFEYSFFEIKKYLPNAKIGGFGCQSNDFQHFGDILQKMKEKGIVPDFVSIIAFPYIQETRGDRYYGKRTASPVFTKECTEAAERFIRGNLPGTPLFLTETNFTLSNRNFLNDSTFRAAVTARMINQIWDIPKMFGMWMGTDWSSSYYDSSHFANGGSGIITKDGVRKPVFYTFSFLNQLGSRLLERGDGYIATTNGTGSFYFLFYNCKEYSPAYFLKREDEVQISEIPELFTDMNSRIFEAELRNLPDGKNYNIRRYTLDSDHGSLLGQWAKFNYEETLERDDVRFITDTCIPDILFEKKKAENGILSLKISVKAQGIVRVHIYEAD